MNNTFLTWDEIYEKLRPQLVDLDALRRRWRRKATFHLLIPLAGVVMIAVGLSQLGIHDEDSGSPNWLMLCLMFAGIITMVLGIIHRGQRLMKNKEFYKDQLVGMLVKAIDPSYISRPRSFIEKIAFMRSNFFEEYDVGIYHGKSLIKGKRGATDFRFCEIKVKDEGNDPLKTTFKGLFFEADFHKHFKGRTILIARKSDHIFRRFSKPLKKFDGERVKLENVRFEKNFNVYATDPVEARYILSLTLMEALNDLQKRFKCKIFASFLGDNMYLAINWRKKLFKGYWSKRADNKMLIGQYYDDITLCLNLVDDLNLNTRIWSKKA